LIKDWTAIFTNLNQKEYTTDWSVDFASLQDGGTNYVSIKLTDILGQTATYYDIFFILKDITKPTIVNNMPSGSDSNWRNYDPGAIYNVGVYDLPTDGSKLSKVQTKVMTGALLTGATVYDWTDRILNINSTYYVDNWGLDFNSLWEGKNYVSVRVYDNAGNFETLTDAFFVLKDTTAPSYTKNPTWDENAWYAYPPTVDVDFNDATSGSGVKGFDIIVSTDVGQGLSLALCPWTQVVSTNTYSYTQNWRIPQSVFDAMISGVTNYCWVRVYDFAANTTTVSDYVFIVKKDTAGVKIVDNEPEGEDTVWRSTYNYAQRSYNIDFYFLGLTPLAAVEYTAYTGPNFTGQKAFDWKTIPGFTPGTTYYETDWQISEADFNLLFDGATNYISVRCWNTAGSTATLKDVFFVKKDTTPPTTPVLSAPLDGTNTNQLNINFVWQPSNDLASGVYGYEIYISTTSDFSVWTSSGFTHVEACAYQLSQGKYYWRVRAVDNASNYGLWSVEYELIIDTTPPNAPNLTAPSDGATTNYTTITFEWGAVSDNGPSGVSHYRLEISTINNFAILYYSSNTLINPFTHSLINSSTYYWRVFAVDRAGNYSSISSTWSIIVDTIPPQVPILVSPINNFATNHKTITFTWSAQDFGPAGIKEFELLVSTSETFDTLWYSTVTTLTSHTTDFVENKYFWKIKVKDRAGNYSEFSSTWTFIVDFSSPQVVQLLSPANDTRTNSTSLSFQWSQVIDFGPSGLRFYELQLSTDINFSVINYSSVTVSNTASLNVSEARYYWRVKSQDKVGNYSISTSSEITVDIIKPYIVDNQAGDDTWRKTGTTTYDVDFFDLPSVNGSGLDYAQYIVYPSTNSDGTAFGTPLTSWQTIFNWSLPIRTTYYTDNWDLSPVWDALQQGYNFVFVRTVDMAGNTTDYSTYVFYVKKDTAAPSVINNEPETPQWINYSKLFNVDFKDDGSGVKIASYTVYTQSSFLGSQLISWTTIFVLATPQNLYDTDWQINFELLQPGTNYVSVWCSDDLENSVTYSDVFKVLKDTIPPNNITDLSSTQGVFGGSIKLQWTSPSDDTISDPQNIKCKFYLVKYSTYNFVDRTDFLSRGTTFYVS